MAYIIIATTPEDDPYVLPDGYESLEQALSVMAHRAEEFIDESVTEDAEFGESNSYSIVPSEDGMEITVRIDDCIATTLTIQAVTIHG